MKLEPILGKIIELTKNIYLKEIEDYALKEDFLISHNELNLPFASFQFWYTKRGTEICRDIAIMSTKYDSGLDGGDFETYEKIIREFFKKNVFNKDLFDTDLLIPIQIEKLFDAIVLQNRPKKFAKKVWDILYQRLLNSLKNWIIIYPLSRVSTKSFNLDYDGVSLANSSDSDFWNQFENKYPALEFWNPEEGKKARSEKSVFSDNPPETWLLCEVKGTKNGSRNKAGNLMKKFLAVLLSYIYMKNPSIIYQSAAEGFSYSLQISSDAKSSYHYSHIEVLLHPLISDIEIDQQIINNINEWYKSYSYASKEKSHRANKGAHFIQYGLSAEDELDKFINFFISLDALFGERGKVKKGIIEGVSNEYTNQVEKLYKLRSELVHGGSSFIEEWDGMMSYREHFNSEPLYDVRKIAMQMLREYFV
ncbi:HEPN domain-containing protein [Halarsenatibacter silvermanii]|uniref:Uncharacterized protein n=1 Tax=Halarsenatibacter silvermanii TaxID=321763 RepID=A0A1G9RWH0_9FIRM|nr:HEPN domain-containing protein [Halarsenatibacter silvermanii]SDM27638.1 hypothetical protein SAMN04488692_12434 [Halarsenatibacter silvermanii]